MVPSQLCLRKRPARRHAPALPPPPLAPPASPPACPSSPRLWPAHSSCSSRRRPLHNSPWGRRQRPVAPAAPPRDAPPSRPPQAAALNRLHPPPATRWTLAELPFLLRCPLLRPRALAQLLRLTVLRAALRRRMFLVADARRRILTAAPAPQWRPLTTPRQAAPACLSFLVGQTRGPLCGLPPHCWPPAPPSARKLLPLPALAPMRPLLAAAAAAAALLLTAAAARPPALPPAGLIRRQHPSRLPLRYPRAPTRAAPRQAQ